MGLRGEILVTDLLPGDLKSILSSYLPTSIEFSLVASYLPVALIVAAGLKSLSTYSFQLKQRTISLWVTKRYRDRLFETLMIYQKKLMEKPAGHWMSVIMNDVLYLQTRFSDMTATFFKR